MERKLKVAMFYHSLVSDWNHGNAHFLRGVATELRARGHQIRVFEPEQGWSLSHLLRQEGPKAIDEFRQAYPGLYSMAYDPETLDLDEALDGVDLVLVHEWNDPALVARIGRHRSHAGYLLFFHDTHHRSVTDPNAMEAFDLRDYDGVLAYGEVIRRIYLERSWIQRAWTWHEAADTRVFRPLENGSPGGDLVWIGNWGDGERARELEEFFTKPAEALRLRARAYGVRYPLEAMRALSNAGIMHRGWLPNYRAPSVFAAHKLTVHVPRRPYRESLPGIPTIRPFEAMACGIPLICSPWEDAEHLFRPGRDYLIARDGAEMAAHMRAVLADRDLAESLSESGLETIRARHTCGHRVEELLAIHAAARREPVHEKETL
jgi:spore maturation protein CgeB